jgi:DNA-binding transcriptional ArsR family regulator
MTFIIFRNSNVIYNTFMNANVLSIPDSSQSISSLMQTLGSPARIQILLAIGTGEACVCHLEALLNLRQAYISQHLMALREAGLVSDHREGKYIYYHLNDPAMLDLLRMAARLAGVSDEALAVQDHSHCECPNCSKEKQ